MRDESGRRGQAAGAARASRRERWARLRHSVWQPPRPHGEQPRERTVGPLELFYDLAVVVLVAQAARHLAGHLTWRGFGEFAAVFTLVWIAWTNGSLHHELHGREDARARSTFLLQILVLVAMAAFIPEAGGARGAAFAVAAAVLFAVLAVLWLLAARGDRPQYRRTSGLFVTGTAACAVLLAATTLLPAGARVLAWGLLDAAYLAGFAAVVLTVAPTRAAALIVTDSLTERFGAFIIIVLGETLTGVVGGLAGEPVTALTMVVGLVAVVVGFGAWWTYFDFAGHRCPRPEPVASVQWMFSHRRRPASATGPRSRARSPAQHPLGTRRCPPPGHLTQDRLSIGSGRDIGLLACGLLTGRRNGWAVSRSSRSSVLASRRSAAVRERWSGSRANPASASRLWSPRPWRQAAPRSGISGGGSRASSPSGCRCA